MYYILVDYECQVDEGKSTAEIRNAEVSRVSPSSEICYGGLFILLEFSYQLHVNKSIKYFTCPATHHNNFFRNQPLTVQIKM